MAVSHIATLLSTVLKKSAELSDTEIKLYEEDDQEMNAKAKRKADLVELAVKMMSVSVTTIYLIHMIVVNVNREHEKALKEIQALDRQKMEEESQKRALQWVNQTTPNKIIQAL